jgi:hypothetical protein
MRWTLCATLFLIACKKAPIDSGPTGPVGINHPDLACAEGTIGLGAAPPDGMEVYCARVFEDGRIVRQGPSIQWHSASRRAGTGVWLDGKRSGAWQTWHANGAAHEQGTYIGGMKEGPWIAFHTNSERASEGEFVGGKENGAWTFWSEDGLTRTEGVYNLGNREGKWIDYGPDDKPVRERNYRNGRLINQREYDN